MNDNWNLCSKQFIFNFIFYHRTCCNAELLFVFIIVSVHIVHR